MTQVFCDECGEVLTTPSRRNVSSTGEKWRVLSAISTLDSKQPDLCGECARKIVETQKVTMFSDHS